MTNKTKKQPKILALVKWVGGPDDGKVTIGIDIDHIKDFNYEQFMADEVDPTHVYVVEWRDTKKEPLGGWKCYNTRVLAVSSSMIVLNKRLEVIGGLTSPKRVPQSAKSTSSTEDSDGDDLDIHVEIVDSDSQKSQQGQRPSNLSNNSSSDKVNPDGNHEPELHDSTTLSHSINSNVGKTTEIDDLKEHQPKKRELDSTKNKCNVSEASTSRKDTGSNFPEVIEVPKTPSKTTDSNVTPTKVVDLTGESTTTTTQYVTKKDFTEAMKNVMDFFQSCNNQIKVLVGQSGNQPSCSGASSATNKSSKDTMMEIGIEGSGVMIRKDMWQGIKQKKSFQVMGCALVFELFSKEVLLRSNYKGGVAKNKPNANLPRYQRLDTKIMDAIRCK